MCRPRIRAATRQAQKRTKESGASGHALAAAALRLLLAQHESHASNRVQKLWFELPVDFPPEPCHLRVNHVVERRLAGCFLPDVSGKHLARYNTVLIQE